MDPRLVHPGRVRVKVEDPIPRWEDPPPGTLRTPPAAQHHGSVTLQGKYTVLFGVGGRAAAEIKPCRYKFSSHLYLLYFCRLVTRFVEQGERPLCSWLRVCVEG